MLPPGGDSGRGVLGGEHAGEHGIVRSLDARHVDHSRGAADQRTTGEG
jgi:hypothetical protein